MTVPPYFSPQRAESPARAKACLTVAVCVVMVACGAFQAEQTVFDLSTYSQHFQGKTVKVKCQKINRFAAAFFCDDGTTPEDVLEIDPDSVDKESLRYMTAHCNDASHQCSGSVIGRFEANEYGDFYIRNATFKFTNHK
ncbi:MAG: hypothetical protein JO133_04280 [Burkholderiaceae bacterium]|nr:hypothetical protein [Burkholderiaceae bacterium]